MSTLPGPVISVVMPVYNAAPYLAEAIQSILDQTFSDFELIIIDDASTDTSYAIAQSFADPRIKILQNAQNRGIVFTRNRGLAAMQGQFYAPFDADDIAMPAKLAKQVHFLRENPAFGMVGCWVKHIDSQGHVLAERWKLKAMPEAILPNLLFRNYFVQSALLIRREAIPPQGYESGFEIGEDYLMWTAIAQHYKVWNLPDYLLAYRRHGQNTTSKDPAALLHYEQRIYHTIYRQLGIAITPPEVKCLLWLKGNEVIQSSEALREIEQFLIRTQEVFLHNWPDRQIELRGVVLNRWFKACYLARRLGGKTLLQLVFSPLLRTNLGAAIRMEFRAMNPLITNTYP